MRKTFLLFAMSAVAVCSAYSQDEATMTESSSSEFKAGDGNKTIEVQFAPLGGNPVSIGGLRFRAFLSETAALRVNLFVGYNSDTEITQQADNTDPNNPVNELKDVTTSFAIDVRPGIEMHMPGTDKLSPYVGGELQFGYRTTTLKSDYDDANNQVQTDKIKNDNDGDGYFQVGLNLLAGVDFYFARNLYLGTEVGFGFQMQNNSDRVVEPAEGVAPPDQTRGSQFNLGPVFVSQLRLGWAF